MYEFKRSLAVLVGMLTLVTIATIAFPHNGRSANSPNNGARTSLPQNVNVVNTPIVGARQSQAANS